MKNKRILSLLLAGTMVLGTTAVLSCCTINKTSTVELTNEDDKQITTSSSLTTDDDENGTTTTKAEGTTTTKAEGTETEEMPRPEPQEVTNLVGFNVGDQLKKPSQGDKIAIIHTTMGDITLRFFPEAAPKAVENFIALAEAGTYNGTIFHRVINNFMIQSGDYEKGDGTGGKSTWGESFEDEFCDKLYNIRGSVSMANAGVDTNGSQFFINQAGPDSFNRNSYDYETGYNNMKSLYQQYIDLYGEEEVKTYYPTLSDFIEAYAGGITPLSYTVPEDVWKLYEENGGNIHLDGAFREEGGHTVFAQVIDGMDVVDKIAGVEVDKETYKPTTDVKITSIEITTYK